MEKLRWPLIIVSLAALALAKIFAPGKQDDTFQARLAQELEADFTHDFDGGKECNHSDQLSVFRKILEDKSAPTEFRIKLNGLDFEVLPYMSEISADMAIITPKGFSYTKFFECGFTASFFTCGKLVTVRDLVGIMYASASSDSSDKSGDSLRYQPAPATIEAVYFGSDSLINFSDLGTELQVVLNHAYRKVIDSAGSNRKLPEKSSPPKAPAEKKKPALQKEGHQASLHDAAAKRLLRSIASKQPNAAMQTRQQFRKIC